MKSNEREREALIAEQFYYEWVKGPPIRGIARGGNLDALAFDFAEDYAQSSREAALERAAAVARAAIGARPREIADAILALKEKGK